ncbi:ulp1 protease family, C-terminal catalytic domain-containing protein, partial [Tanacetum coccineum]
PFFNTFMLGDKLPCCYVDGVTYGVTWFVDSVEKAYFPINGEDNHWVLVELHIRSGVITLYDSLPPQNTLLNLENGGLTRGNVMRKNFQSY